MNILILHMRYAPDATGTGPLVTQLAQDLAKAGERVSVITSAPHYGQSEVAVEYRRGILSLELEADVQVWRTAAFPWWAGSVLGRAIDYAIYTTLAFLASLLVRKPDVILAVAPPITVGPLAWLISKLRGVPFAYNAQDIWPDGLIRMGRLRNPAAITLFRWLESWIYRVSDRLLVVSKGMKQNMAAKGVPQSKVEVIPNWVDLEAIKPMSKDNPFCREHELQDRFVVLFAGNLGYAAGLEVIVEAAAFCRKVDDILFLFVGDGSAKAQLERLAGESGLKNLRFLPTQPENKLNEMLASADLSIVSLRVGMGGLSVPSKTYAYMASGRPILASVPPDSAIRFVIDEADCGRIVPPSDGEAIGECVLEMKSLGEELNEMGARARQYAEQHCGRKVAVQHYHRQLQILAGEITDQ